MKLSTVAVSITLAGVALGFVPLHQPARLSSYHRPTNHLSSPTALQANFLDRFVRVTMGTINNALKSIEDPEKVMNQALEDMQGDLIKVRQAYAEITATQRRMNNKRVQLEAAAGDWYRRAQLALRKQNEGLAREALARREALLQQAATVRADIDAQAKNTDKLYEGMQALEKKIQEANSKKSQMAARARTAKSTKKVNDMLSGLTGKTSMDAFNRMEEKVLAMEAAAEVASEMGKNIMMKGLPVGGGKDPKATSKVDIEVEFRRLESSAAVDKELEKLKTAMLPSSTSSYSSNRSVDIPVRLGADIDVLSR